MLKYRTYTLLTLCRVEPFLNAYGPGTSEYQIRGIRTTNELSRRRTLTPPPWIPKKEKNIVKILKPREREAFEGLIDTVKSTVDAPKIQIRPRSTSIPWKKGEQVWNENSKRFGLIGKKIGMTPQWTTEGRRVMCTLIEIPENHIVSAIDPANWFKTSLVGKRKAFGRFGPRWKVTIGAENISPAFLTDGYRRTFEKAGVPAKRTLGSFLCTEDAVAEPGTKLDVRHFSVGQFVNVTGKTIDWGFQGAVHRWGFKGQPKYGTTKAHRRVGTIGSTGDHYVWPGKRMPGHMGYEWQTVRGLEILRINPIKQVLYIKGTCPGDIGEMLLIKDILVGKKKVKDPPFPTYEVAGQTMGEDDDHVKKATYIISQDIYHPKLFKFTSPSLTFDESTEVKAVRDRTKAKLAKAKK